MSSKTKARGSTLEGTFAWQLEALKVERPVLEHQFFPGRKWRFDFAWPKCMLAVELEGGVFTRGRHTRVTGFLNDLEKYNAAALAGWKVLRYGQPQVKCGRAAAQVAEILKHRSLQGLVVATLARL